MAEPWSEWVGERNWAIIRVCLRALCRITPCWTQDLLALPCRPDFPATATTTTLQVPPTDCSGSEFCQNATVFKSAHSQTSKDAAGCIFSIARPPTWYLVLHCSFAYAFPNTFGLCSLPRIDSTLLEGGWVDRLSWDGPRCKYLSSKQPCLVTDLFWP